jgi:hypothetical protein
MVALVRIRWEVGGLSLGCGLSLKSIPQKINLSNHQHAIFLDSSGLEFSIREALYLREQGAKGVVTKAFKPVEGQKVPHYIAGHPAIDSLSVVVALK